MVEVLSRFGFAQFCSPYFAMDFLFPFVPKKKSGPNLYLKKGHSVFWELGSLLGSHYTRL
jgi:hypothetical protein